MERWTIGHFLQRAAILALFVLAASILPAGASGAQPLPLPLEESKRFAITGSGDVLIHGAVYQRARAQGTRERPYDFRPMFRPIRRLVSAAHKGICHLEVPLSRDNTNLSSYPNFNAPHQVADGIAFAGFDTCSTASNHSLDQGEAGVRSTIDVLRSYELKYEGTAKTKRGGRLPSFWYANGVRVGHLSYTYGFNGHTRPDGKWWLANPIEPRRIVRDARLARDKGADFVVVSLHWGTEYQRKPNAQQRDLARFLLKKRPIDLILGHHAHVVQAIKRINGKFVVYGMGNFLSAQRSPVDTQDGLIVRVKVVEKDGRFKVRRIFFIPTWVEPSTYRILPVAQKLNDPDTPDRLRPHLRASWKRTVRAVRSEGRDKKVRPLERPRS